MYFQFAATFLTIGLALFIAYVIVLAYSNSLLDKKDRNHFRNSFPYNFYMDDSIILRVILYVLLGLSVLSACVGESFFFLSLGGYGMFIAGGILLPLSLLFLSFSNILPLSFYKLHIAFAVLGFLSFCGSMILLSVITPVVDPALNAEGLSVVSRVFFGVMGFASLFSLINPKLMDWSKMEKAEENGKSYYVKPKFNFLALYEWIFLAEEFVAAFLCFINIISSNLITLS